MLARIDWIARSVAADRSGDAPAHVSSSHQENRPDDPSGGRDPPTTVVRALDEREIDRYAQVLSEIKARMLEVEKLDPSLPFPDVEIACLHLRIVLEAIVMSSLLANQHAVGAVAAAFDKGDVGQVRKVVKRVNPDYWPRPVKDVRKRAERADGRM